MQYAVEVIGGLLVLIKGLVLYIWFNHDSKLKAVSSSQTDLKEKLMSNYYDKSQTERYVDKEINAVQQSIDRLTDAIIPLTIEMRKLNDKIIVLETKEQLNGGVRGSS